MMERRRRDEVAILRYLPKMTGKTYGAFMLWVCCAYLLIFAAAPASSPAALDRYDEYMRAAASTYATDAEADVARLQAERDEWKVLFYSFREPYKTLVATKQAEVRAARARGDAGGGARRRSLALNLFAPAPSRDSGRRSTCGCRTSSAQRRNASGCAPRRARVRAAERATHCEACLGSVGSAGCLLVD